MYRSSTFPWTYVESMIEGIRSRERFRDVRFFTMFIGQPRSGTSLVGSLLNSHRNMCIAQELNALRYVKRGYGRSQLYWLLYQRDRQFARNGRVWTGYDYVVPGQWQGRSESLLVIGDKKAGLSTDQLTHDPDLLVRLQHLVQVPIRIFHVVRNPFNVIATIHRKRKRTSLPLAASMYFRRCESNWRLMQDASWNVKSFRLESLIAEPRATLTELCQFVNLEARDDFIKACCQKLFDKPRQSHTTIDWPRDLVRSVRQQMKEYPFLEGYEFGDRTASNAA